MDYTSFMGRSQFGPAYQTMLNRDTHACGSVDRVLTERMVRLCEETAGYLYGDYTPVTVRYKPGSRPELEKYLDRALSDCSHLGSPVEAIVCFTARLAESAASVALDALQFGGTEEEIIRRGSDWCTDLARVACLLCQVAGAACRIVCLYDTTQAYSGHVIIEAYDKGKWGTFDPTDGVAYRETSGLPASTWAIMTGSSEVVARDCKQGSASQAFNRGQFQSAALVNYLVHETNQHDYTISGPNDYYRAILDMSQNGWPGGLRWLFAEDQPVPATSGSGNALSPYPLLPPPSGRAVLSCA